MRLDLSAVPFSRYGSYLAFSTLPATGSRQAGLYLRHVHGPGDLNTDPFQPVFRLDLLDGEGRPVPFTPEASPTLLSLQAAGPRAGLCLPDPGTVRLRCTGGGLRLQMDTGPYDYAVPRGGDRWHICRAGADAVSFMLTPLRGQVAVHAEWNGLGVEGPVILDLLPGPDGTAEAVLEEFITVWRPGHIHPTFDAARRQVEMEFDRWRAGIPAVPPEYTAAAEEAACILWSCVVAPLGHLTRPAVLMSKGRMSAIWSWDNCFNAVALSAGHPTLAWDQLMVMFDHQDAHGQLPDLMNDRLDLWSFNKPPVQGWALRQMMARTPAITPDHLAELYPPLARWTEWWFRHRDDDQDGIPQYNHGNDSGWDNSTLFLTHPPIEAPDLCAYLVIQMDVLAEIASRLGQLDAARQWRARSDTLLKGMLAHFWDGSRFIARQSGTHRPIQTGSLQLYLPLVLGTRLPREIYRRMVVDLEQTGRFLTRHGLATESLDSPHFRPDGYWRGPVWAAPVMLIGEGLRAGGQARLARDLYRRFCDTVARNGIAENYNAHTGEGLRERGFTWTAGIFLALASGMG